MKRIVVVLTAIAGAIALTASAFLIGHASQDGGPAPIADSSVDAGFARDMAVHHERAILMAS